MFAEHRIVTGIGASGAALILAHGILGPSIVPFPVGLAGLIVAVASGLYLFLPGRTSKHQNDKSESRRRAT